MIYEFLQQTIYIIEHTNQCKAQAFVKCCNYSFIKTPNNLSYLMSVIIPWPTMTGVCIMNPESI